VTDTLSKRLARLNAHPEVLRGSLRGIEKKGCVSTYRDAYPHVRILQHWGLPSPIPGLRPITPSRCSSSSPVRMTV